MGNIVGWEYLLVLDCLNVGWFKAVIILVLQFYSFIALKVNYYVYVRFGCVIDEFRLY